jgi:hypothetical protein
VAPRPTETEAPQKPLLWSAGASLDSGAENTGESDQSHVPPVLRGLRKCDACGFPISSGRVLCVECEEKKWRGQLKRPMPTGAVAAEASGQKKEEQTFTAAAPSVPGTMAAPTARQPIAPSVVSAPSVTGPEIAKPNGSKVPASANDSPGGKVEPERTAQNAESRSPDVILSAGLEPSQTWFTRNKYVVGVLVLVAVAVAVIFLLR